MLQARKERILDFSMRKLKKRERSAHDHDFNGNNDRQGVIKTPCRFYFGCYIDTLCGINLRNRMSGAAARHFFLLENVAKVSARIGINLPLKKRPADGGATANAAAGGAGASIAQMYICTACWVSPSPQCRLRAEVTRQRRRKEHEMAEIEKDTIFILS